MKVPILENQSVPEQPTLLQTPQISKGIPGAFGEAPAEATEKLGEAGVHAGTALLQHIEWQQYQASMDKMYDVHKQLADAIKDKMFSTDTEPVKSPDWAVGKEGIGTYALNPDGTPMIQSKGVMNRPGFGAHGSTLEMKQFTDDLLPQLKAQLPNNDLIHKNFDRLANTTIDSAYSSVIENEAKQMRAGSANLKNSTISNLISQASLAQTPELLSKNIDAVSHTTNEYADFTDMDSKTRQKTIGDSVAKTVQSAVLSTLQDKGYVQAEALLKSTQKQMPPDHYKDLTQKLARMNLYFQRRNIYTQKVNTLQNRFSALNAIANNKLNLDNLSDLAKKTSGVDNPLSEAIQNYVDSGGDYMTHKPEDVAFENVTKSVFESGSQEDIAKHLVRALNHSANGEISQERLNILVNASINRSKVLKSLNEDDNLPSDPKQNEIDAGVKSIINDPNHKDKAGILDNFFKFLNGGQSPQDAHTNAVNTNVIKDNPLPIKHKLGDIITNSRNEQGQVVGFNDNGTPIIRKKINGQRPGK